MASPLRVLCLSADCGGGGQGAWSPTYIVVLLSRRFVCALDCTSFTHRRFVQNS